MYVIKAVVFLVFVYAQLVNFAKPVVAFHEFSNDGNVVAFTQNSGPKYLINENTITGICGDIYAQLQRRLKAKNIELVVSNHLLPIRRILDSLIVRDAGIFCGASRDTDREKLFKYSAKPLYTITNVLITSAKNTYDPISLKDLRQSNASVGTYFGTGSSKYLKAMGVKRINGKFKSLEKGLKSVAAREIDYFFYHNLGLEYSLSKTPLALRMVPTIFRTYSHWMIYSKNMPEEIQKTLDDELTKMVDEGVVENIRKKYQLSTN